MHDAVVCSNATVRCSLQNVIYEFIVGGKQKLVKLKLLQLPADFNLNTGFIALNLNFEFDRDFLGYFDV